MSATNKTSSVDTIKLIAAIAIFLVAVYGYYQVSAMGYPLVVSILALLVGVAASVFVFVQTASGSALYSFFLSSNQELRRVIWPTRQETVQLTLVVVFVVLLFGLFLWVVDQILTLIRNGILG